jgi:hypothetical protein
MHGALSISPELLYRTRGYPMITRRPQTPPFGHDRISASAQEIADNIEHHEVIIHETDRFGRHCHPCPPQVNALLRRR